MKIIKFTLLGAALALSTSVFAAVNNFASTYELQPNELVTIKGDLLSKRKLDCEVRSESVNENKLSLISLKHDNIINGVILPEGQTTYLSSYVGDHLFIEMEHRAQLGLTNNSDSLVNLRCK